jgi:hypothetical protein
VPTCGPGLIDECDAVMRAVARSACDLHNILGHSFLADSVQRVQRNACVGVQVFHALAVPFPATRPGPQA